MGWLRRDKDCISLVLAWAILIQAIILSFTSGLHAATLASGSSGAVILCTTKGAVIGQQLPGQGHNKADCQCCLIGCRLSCGGVCGGVFPVAFGATLLHSVSRLATRPRLDSPSIKASEAFSAKPRAPPHHV
jgi:hypothetical protein